MLNYPMIDYVHLYVLIFIVSSNVFSDPVGAEQVRLLYWL